MLFSERFTHLRHFLNFYLCGEKDTENGITEIVDLSVVIRLKDTNDFSLIAVSKTWEMGYAKPSFRSDLPTMGTQTWHKGFAILHIWPK